MAQLKIKKKFCDRCIRDAPATSTERFSYAGVDYEIDVCDQHADMLARDMHIWTRLSREKERSSFFARSEAELETHRRLGYDRPTYDRVISMEKVPTMPVDTSLVFTLTTHAEERLAQRGPIYDFTREDVLLAAHAPEEVEQQDDGAYRYRRGKVVCVVDRSTAAILTIMPAVWLDAKQEASSGRR